MTPAIISSFDVTNAKGNIEHQVTVGCNILLIDSESGESIDLYGIGTGQDAGDKAVMKAETAAIKYAYLLSMAISTGDDPEADNCVEPTGNGNSDGSDVYMIGDSDTVLSESYIKED